MRAIKGWISIYHGAFSVLLNLSILFGQTIRQEYTNFGVLLKGVNETFSVSMHETMGSFPVGVTEIKAPPLTQKLLVASFVTLCLENLLELVLPPFDDPIG